VFDEVGIMTISPDGKLGILPSLVRAMLPVKVRHWPFATPEDALRPLGPNKPEPSTVQWIILEPRFEGGAETLRLDTLHASLVERHPEARCIYLPSIADDDDRLPEPLSVTLKKAHSPKGRYELVHPDVRWRLVIAETIVRAVGNAYVSANLASLFGSRTRHYTKGQTSPSAAIQVMLSQVLYLWPYLEPEVQQQARAHLPLPAQIGP
jgi:hypothetical protein